MGDGLQEAHEPRAPIVRLNVRAAAAKKMSNYHFGQAWPDGPELAAGRRLITRALCRHFVIVA
jgi:hypothetical protein